MAILITSTTFFFFNDTATTEIYTLSLHDALPISDQVLRDRLEQRPLLHLPVRDRERPRPVAPRTPLRHHRAGADDLGLLLLDRKSTRLNSSHANISYAVFCLKKKKQTSHSNFIVS